MGLDHQDQDKIEEAYYNAIKRAEWDREDKIREAHWNLYGRDEYERRCVEMELRAKEEEKEQEQWREEQARREEQAWREAPVRGCGASGNNVTATLSEGTLTISGSGRMNDYECEGVFRPWHYYLRKHIVEVVIEDGVTSVGESAFRDCWSLTSVTIPDSVTSIGESAFRGCWSLTSVTIPDGVTSIGKRAFFGCTRIGWKSVTIPKSLMSIGNGAFLKGIKETTWKRIIHLMSNGDGAFSTGTMWKKIIIAVKSCGWGFLFTAVGLPFAPGMMDSTLAVYEMVAVLLFVAGLGVLLLMIAKIIEKKRRVKELLQ